jgi:hypothetical protein
VATVRPQYQHVAWPNVCGWVWLIGAEAWERRWERECVLKRGDAGEGVGVGCFLMVMFKVGKGKGRCW